MLFEPVNVLPYAKKFGSKCTSAQGEVFRPDLQVKVPLLDLYHETVDASSNTCRADASKV